MDHLFSRTAITSPATFAYVNRLRWLCMRHFHSGTAHALSPVYHCCYSPVYDRFTSSMRLAYAFTYRLLSRRVCARLSLFRQPLHSRYAHMLLYISYIIVPDCQVTAPHNLIALRVTAYARADICKQKRGVSRVGADIGCLICIAHSSVTPHTYSLMVNIS